MAGCSRRSAPADTCRPATAPSTSGTFPAALLPAGWMRQPLFSRKPPSGSGPTCSRRHRLGRRARHRRRRLTCQEIRAYFIQGIFVRSGTAADAESFGGDLQARRGLLPFVFVAIHFVDDVAHQFDGQTRVVRRSARRLHNPPHRPCRTRSSTSYSGSESVSFWSARNSAEGGFVKTLSGIAPDAGGCHARKRVNQRLRHVADHGQAAAHIAIERAVADGQFALVAGGQHQRAPLIRQGHQCDAAQARLQVLLGDVARRAGEKRIRASLRNCIVAAGDRDDLEANAEILRHRPRIGNAALGRVRSRHADAGDILAPTASTAIAAVSDESMPPLSPISTRLKPHLRI